MQNQFDKLYTSEVALHPKATLQDYYKLFFQGCFGAEHALTNIQEARNYFNNELAATKFINSNPIQYSNLIQDISLKLEIYRVHLKVIDMRIVTKNELFTAFIKSGETISEHLKQQWSHLWQEIETFLIPKLSPAEDEIIKLRKAAANRQIVHHSKLYRELYSPHYRIITKANLPDSLLKLI